ncbi:MAG TPA: hypothetical protein VFN61_07955 [Acidimicrobiales bacterium]|nr:hypothetical protein [Acidimicrobiales bacterium]
MTHGTSSDRPADKASPHGADIYHFTPPPPTPHEIAGVTALRMARRRRRLRRTAAGLAVVIGGSTGTAVAALSTGAPGQSAKLTATNVTTTTTGAPATTQPAPRQPVMPRRGPLPAMRWRRELDGGPMSALLGPVGLGGDVLHGTYTVKTASGAYETVQIQRGTAGNVSANTIEVRSADGYVQSYAVSSGTVVDAGSQGITSINNGDSVVVQATVSGTAVTAQRVVDMTRVRAERNRWPQGPGPTGGSPVPAA